MIRHLRGPLVILGTVLALGSCSGEAEPAPTKTPPVPTQPATGEPATSQPATTRPATTTAAPPTTTDVPAADELVVEAFPVPAGSHPHDVAPAVDGGVWYTAQGSSELGYLDPTTGATEHVDLGAGSAPHGVIVGPDGAPWITEGGLNAIVTVDPEDRSVTVPPLPGDRPDANLNTATFIIR
jgi:virginiamycin B lyase